MTLNHIINGYHFVFLLLTSQKMDVYFQELDFKVMVVT